MFTRDLPSSAPNPVWLADVETIAAAFMGAFPSGLPRYLQLRQAIIQLIQSGKLRPGAQLPPDQQLTVALGLSLGTVQKAFSGLASEGWISREHGRGTFIEEPPRPVTEVWHYRFVDPQSGDLLPVYSRILQRRKIVGEARLRHTLGEDPQGYVEIERLIDIDGKFACYSQFYLSASRFSRMLDLPVSAIQGNLKQVLADEFNAPTNSVEQRIRACILEPEVGRLIGAPKGAAGMVSEVTAFSHGRTRLWFQRTHIPASEYWLDVSPLSSPARNASVQMT